MVDFSKPVDVELNGSTTSLRLTPSLKTCCETLVRRADPGYCFTAEFDVCKDAKTGRLALAPPAK
jgi:hypothetical protein